jgi:WD40 repeat protein
MKLQFGVNSSLLSITVYLGILQTKEISMKILRLFTLMLLLPLMSLHAQDQQIPPTEIISSQNIDNLELLAQWQAEDNELATAAFNPDSTILAIALSDGVVRLLDFPSLEQRTLLTGAQSDATRILFSRDGSRLMLSSDFNGTNEFWNLDTDELISKYTQNPDEIWSDVDSDLLNLVTVNHDAIVTIRDIDTGNEVFSVVQDNILPFPTLNADGSLLLTVDSDGFSVWDVNNAAVIHQFIQPDDTELSGFGFTPDGRVIWANWRDWLYGRDFSENRSVIQFWNAEDGSQVNEMQGGGSHLRMYFAPSGNRIATAGENDQLQNSVWVWNIESGELLGEAGIPTGGGTAGFSPDGELLAVAAGTNTEVYLWAANSPEIPISAAIDIGSGTVTPPTFSVDGRFLLTVGYDVRLWGVIDNS